MRRTTSGQPATRPADWSWRLHAACPVLGPCRQHALAHREWYGAWGRLGERERQAMQRGTEHRSSVMR